MNKSSLAILLAVPALLVSCIAAEQENTECDIEAVSLHLDTPLDFFYHEYDTLRSVISSEDNVQFSVRSYAEVGSIPTTIRITPGATAYLLTESGEQVPFQNGSAIDYSEGKVCRFLVTSEDKAWSRQYTVSVVNDKPSDGNLTIDFESYRLEPDGKYYIWDAPDVFTDGLWKNGNPGFKISKSSAKPLEYPSTPVAQGGPDGSDCVKLETCDTGPFGRMVNMRLASGSMFNGIFDVGNALTDALKATQFGSPFIHKPVMLRLWLRYEAGPTYQNPSGTPVPGIVDEPDVYCVLFRNEDPNGNKVQVDGNDVLTNPYIIGLGRLPHHYNDDGSDQASDSPIHGVTGEWKEFTIHVHYTSEPDPDILREKGYSIIIGLASSWGGAYFKGAIGSKLYVDNLQLICE